MIINYENKKYDVKEITFAKLINAGFSGTPLLELFDNLGSSFFNLFNDNICTYIKLPERALRHLLYNHTYWLIENRLAKEVIEETKLEPGMILQHAENHSEIHVLTGNKLYPGKGWTISCILLGNSKSYKTLEEYNQRECGTPAGKWKVKEF